MKFRKGFVSNSSSTAFIVAFPCMAHTLPLRSVRELLFRGREGVGECSAEQLAEAVLQDMQSGPVDYYEACEWLKSGYFPDAPEFDYEWMKLPRDECVQKMREYELELGRHVAEKVKEWLESHNNRYLYKFDFEDHSELGAALGNGIAFLNMPNLRSDRR